MMYGMIHLCQRLGNMSGGDLGLLLMAYVCCDLDHPGDNNTYVNLYFSVNVKQLHRQYI